MKVTIKISTPTRNLKASVKVSRRMEVVTNSFVIHSARYVSQRLVSVFQSTLDVLKHIGRMTWKLPKSLLLLEAVVDVKAEEATYPVSKGFTPRAL